MSSEYRDLLEGETITADTESKNPMHGWGPVTDRSVGKKRNHSHWPMRVLIEIQTEPQTDRIKELFTLNHKPNQETENARRHNTNKRSSSSGWNSSSSDPDTSTSNW
jgi:hypothetical protein